MKMLSDQELAKMTPEALQAHGQALQAEKAALTEYGRKVAKAMDHQTLLENSLRSFAKMNDQALEIMKLPPDTLAAVRAYRQVMETEQGIAPSGVPSGEAVGGV